MNLVAFFVDGHFLFRKITQFKSFFVDGPNIRAYCARHLAPDEEFYRIFYYDCPPLERVAKKPSGETIDFGASSSSKRMKTLFDSIRETPEMALRLGKSTWQNDWIVKPKSLEAFLSGGETDYSKIAALGAEYDALGKTLEQQYERWEELAEMGEY